MTLGQLLVLYLMAGCGVAAAVYLSARHCSSGQRGFRVASAAVFWPLYLPLLLTPGAEGEEQELSATGSGTLPPSDELAHAIAQVDAELEGTLQSLDGWAEGVLAREKERLHELRGAWSVQARRIREMDRILSRPVGELRSLALPAQQAETPFSERLQMSQEVIRQNRERLRQVRERSFHDLLGTLAWVRELVSMIHLAKFTGAPASRAEELVAQIAAAVEGLSAMTWQEEAMIVDSRPALPVK